MSVDAVRVARPSEAPSRGFAAALQRFELIPTRRFVLYGLVGFLLLALCAYWPLYPFNTHLLVNSTGGDNVQQPWFLGYVPWAIFHGHNPFFTTYVDYPRGVNMAASTIMPLLALLMAPITLTMGPLVTYNTLMWLAFPLSATSALFAVRKLTASNIAALVAGLLYGFSPYMTHQGFAHLNLTFVPLPPLIFYVIYKVVYDQHGRAWRWGVLLGALVVAQFYISSEILASSMVVAILVLVIWSLLNWRHFTTARLGFIAQALAPGVALVAVAVAYPVYFQFFGPNHLNAPAQNGIANPYRSDLIAAIMPTAVERFSPGFMKSIGDKLLNGAIAESGGYLGIPLITLFGITILRFRRNKRILFCAAMAVMCWVLSMGPYVISNTRLTTFELPFNILGQLPLVNDILPVRLSLYVMFFVALTLAFGISQWIADERTSPRRRRGPGRVRVGSICVAAVSTIAIISLIPAWPIASASLNGFTPAFFSSAPARSIPSGSVVLTYPYNFPNYDQGLVWQMQTKWRWRVLGGYFAIPGRYPHTTDAYPWPTPPLDVVNYLAYLQTGSTNGYYLPVTPPTFGPKLIGETKLFVTRYHVRTIIVQQSFVHSPLAIQLMSAAFGKPLIEGGVAAWFNLH